MEVTTDAKYLIAGLVVYTIIGILLTKYQFKEFVKDHHSHDALGAAVTLWPIFLCFVLWERFGVWVRK